MTTLTVTAKGQVTLKKELLQHLGVKPGQKIEVDALPNRQIAMKAAPRTGSWEEIYGMLAGKTGKVATIEEMNEAIRKGWAGASLPARARFCCRYRAFVNLLGFSNGPTVLRAQRLHQPSGRSFNVPTLKLMRLRSMQAFAFWI